MPEISEISSVAVILVAAGRGQRFGGETPKQYVDLSGRTVLRRSVERFLDAGRVGYVLPVIHADDRGMCDGALDGVLDQRLMEPVPGGATRAASVRCGLEALESVGPSHVLIHDAARPFVPVEVIDAVIDALETAEGACAALPVVDALWASVNGEADHSVPRDGLWRAQTPQGFDFSKILAAHQSHDGSGADDVAVAREAGMTVKLVPGSERNFKITTQADMVRALADLGAEEG